MTLNDSATSPFTLRMTEASRGTLGSTMSTVGLHVMVTDCLIKEENVLPLIATGLSRSHGGDMLACDCVYPSHLNAVCVCVRACASLLRSSY